MAKAKSSTSSSSKKKKSATVQMDRRRKKDQREASDRRTKSDPVAGERRKVERRAKVSRRRQIDPTTCERDYSDAEVEFMQALDVYKRTSGRMFPTCSEILEVIRDLGYVKQAPVETPAGDAEVVEVVETTDEPSSTDEPVEPAGV